MTATATMLAQLDWLEDWEEPMVRFEPRYTVNEHGVVLDPNIIEIQIPCRLKATAEIWLAQTVDGLWVSAEKAEIIGVSAGCGGHSSPITVFDYQTPLREAIRRSASRIHEFFAWHPFHKEIADAFWNNDQLQNLISGEMHIETFIGNR